MTSLANIQAITEYAEHLSSTRNNATFSTHAGIYLQYQLQIRVFVEWHGTFKNLPAAFATKNLFLQWANSNNQEILPVADKIPQEHAVATIGKKNGPTELFGQKFVWVKATSNLYRNAFKAWIKSSRSKKSVEDIQGDHILAAEYCYGLIEELEKRTIRSKIPCSKRSKLIQDFRKLAEDFLKASECPALAYKERDKIDLLDRAIDADHVINRKSLENLPDAWVMLAPVCAATNRKFGRIVERASDKAPKQTEIIPLDALVALKLHAHTIPTCLSELKKVFKDHKGRYIDGDLVNIRKELAEAELIVEGLIERKFKKFSRFS